MPLPYSFLKQLAIKKPPLKRQHRLIGKFLILTGLLIPLAGCKHLLTTNQEDRILNGPVLGEMDLNIPASNSTASDIEASNIAAANGINSKRIETNNGVEADTNFTQPDLDRANKPKEAMTQPNKQFAVVLVSSSLDAKLIKINGIRVIPHRSPTREVFGFYMEQNKRFSLTSMTYQYRGDTETIHFRQTKSLLINRPGIYFYGSLYKKRHMIFLEYMQHPKTLEYASYRYSELFSQMEPINFDY